MGNVREGVRGGLSPFEEAILWFVKNAADRTPDRATVLRWERWCDNPRNRAEYEGVVEMWQQILSLSAPLQPSGEAVVADAGAGRLGSTGSDPG
jgi:ferric-dicitrate binding protein FerR (iron transport regulator)